jgi:hypothetical protein
VAVFFYEAESAKVVVCETYDIGVDGVGESAIFELDVEMGGCHVVRESRGFEE